MAMTPAEKLMAARCRLMTREPWYGHMAMSMEWKESEMSWIPEEARSIGIKIDSSGTIQCHYYPAWVESLTLPRLFGAIEHCINHLIRLHTLRQSGREKQAWDLACFKPTEIVMGDIPKPIAQVEIGDEVFGRFGPTRVVNTMKKAFSGDLIVLKARYLLPFAATPEHPILAVEWKLKTTSNPKTTVKEYGEPQFIEASKLIGSDGMRGKPARSGYALVIPKPLFGHTTELDLDPYIVDSCQSRPINRSLALNSDLAWLMGLYVAEGSHSQENRTIQFSLGSDEIDVAECLVSVFADLGYSANINIDGPNLRVLVASPVLARAFGDWFGRSSHTKHLPGWLVRESSKEIFASFMAGYFEGDGCVVGLRNCGFTVSEALAKQIQLMGFSHGIPFSVSKIVRPERTIGKYVLPIEVGYQIEANNWQANEMFAQTSDRRIRNFYHDTHNAVYVPLISVNNEYYEGDVHNFETEDHTYVVSNAIVHNCDMVVNGREAQPRVGYKEDNGKVTLPYSDMVWIPTNWPDTEDAEYYYNRIIEQSKQKSKDGKGQEEQDQGQGQGQGQGKGKGQQGQGQGQGQGGEPSQHQYQHGQFKGGGVDDHDMWSQSEVSQDEARQIIHERVRDATEKSQGHVPGHLVGAVEKLKQPVVRWREELRQYFGVHVGNKRKTYSRVERRNQRFGDKGISHHAASKVLVICDTSGSIGATELEQFFAEIEAIAYRSNVSLLQWDAAYQGYDKYRRNDWKKIKVRGGGGTDMSAPFKWAEENGAIGDIVILLTDGFCNYSAPKSYPTVFCITTPKGASAPPEWGKIIYMKIHE